MDNIVAGRRIASLRRARGWSQEELARRIGVSRAGVGAIETGRTVPSVTTALRLAQALGCSVESLFAEPPSPRWAGAPASEGDRVWLAADRALRAEPTAVGEIAHDARIEGGSLALRRNPEAPSTLVLAGCDPAVGLLVGALAERGVRLIPLHRSSQAALRALAEGVADVAGVHLADPEGNAEAVRETLGAGHVLAHLATWREGVAVAGGAHRAVGSLVRRATWIAREPGSGARACLEDLFREEGREPRFRRVARDHRAVAQLVRDGWGTAGVCVELVAREADLGFVATRAESYDLCVPAHLADDPRVRALLDALRDRSLRGLIADLAGYDPSAMGEVLEVA